MCGIYEVLFSHKNKWSSDTCFHLEKNPGNIILSKISQIQKGEFWFHLIYGTWCHQIHGDRKPIPRDWGAGRMGNYHLMVQSFCLEWWKVLEIDSGDGCTTISELYTSKKLKWQILCCTYSATIKIYIYPMSHSMQQNISFLRPF